MMIMINVDSDGSDDDDANDSDDDIDNDDDGDDNENDDTNIIYRICLSTQLSFLIHYGNSYIKTYLKLF